jgi:cyclopropane fatty-acyl-phospholipid synthase-like methyltransferase/CheY-like chemotaxis protein
MRLELTKEMSVVGEAGDGKAALTIIRQTLPDVVVMDIGLPAPDGLTVTQMLRAENSPARVVIHSMHDDVEMRAGARAAGAFAFVSKYEGIPALLRAIRDAVNTRTLGAPTAMQDFYHRYYLAAATSRAHAEFCADAYGKNLCQHGFATVQQVDELIRAAHIDANVRVLDLGCGNGMIAEYIAEVSDAWVTGLDYSDIAIALANQRTQGKRARLDFVVGDLTAPQLPPHSFDVLVSIDTLYFSGDYAKTLECWRALLRRGGQMAIFYSHGVNPENPKETFDARTLAPDHTPLADALRKIGLGFEVQDFTRHDVELAQRKKESLGKLKDVFEAEGNMFLYENRMSETQGVLRAIELGMHVRYLYRAHT